MGPTSSRERICAACLAEDISEEVVSEHPVHFIRFSLCPEDATNLSLNAIPVICDVDQRVLIRFASLSICIAIELLVRHDTKQVEEVLLHLHRCTVDINEA